MLQDTKQYFSDKERADKKTSVTDKSKSGQQQMEWIQEQRKWMLEK